MNFKKFQMLNYKLNQLLDEQLNLFLFERNKWDVLRAEQLSQKFPDISQAKKQNNFAILSVIEEINSVMNFKPVNRQGQQGIFG